jgi:cytochrome P450
MQVDDESPLEYPPSRSDPLRPPDYGMLRQKCPVAPALFPNGTQGWVITRYDDVKAVCTDPRFSADTTKPGFPQTYPGQANPKTVNRSIVAEDPPEHDIHRRMLSSHFTVRASESLRPTIVTMIDDLVANLQTLPQPVDLVANYALPLPIRVICTLLGFPLEHSDFIAERTTVRLSFAATALEVEQATTELQECIENFIDEKRQHPCGDLVSELVREELETGHLSRPELIDMIQLLLVAGHETTANAISLSIATLLDHPKTIAELRSNRKLLVPAVEELLRFLSVAETTVPRVTTADVVIADQKIRKGEGVRALTCSGNYDESVYPNPTEFDIDRGSRNHLAFGYGIHKCLGQTYARIEMQESLWALITRLPGLRRSDPDAPLDAKVGVGVSGLRTFDVEWD